MPDRHEPEGYGLEHNGRVTNGKDGLKLTRKASRDPCSADRELLSIMITAHADEERVFAAHDVGITEILTKPTTTESSHIREDGNLRPYFLHMADKDTLMLTPHVIEALNEWAAKRNLPFAQAFN